MPLIDLRPWVLQFVEVASNFIQADANVRHDPTSVRERSRPTRRAVYDAEATGASQPKLPSLSRVRAGPAGTVKANSRKDLT
jgi:hypothetical protein